MTFSAWSCLRRVGRFAARERSWASRGRRATAGKRYLAAEGWHRQVRATAQPLAVRTIFASVLYEAERIQIDGLVSRGLGRTSLID